MCDSDMARCQASRHPVTTISAERRKLREASNHPVLKANLTPGNLPDTLA